MMKWEKNGPMARRSYALITWQRITRMPMSVCCEHSDRKEDSGKPAMATASWIDRSEYENKMEIIIMWNGHFICTTRRTFNQIGKNSKTITKEKNVLNTLFVLMHWNGTMEGRKCMMSNTPAHGNTLLWTESGEVERAQFSSGSRSVHHSVDLQSIVALFHVKNSLSLSLLQTDNEWWQLTFVPPHKQSRWENRTVRFHSMNGNVQRMWDELTGFERHLRHHYNRQQSNVNVSNMLTYFNRLSKQQWLNVTYTIEVK